ncbi:hypothetical protein BP6252_05880 [Coleophoma cylindrospora]|uniref:Uncharacterized protein n=1 Tax=Coleophoma cylindrospora TaxID=1849047 RepID=A0A3D8RUT0_9HELO|nr:hypothetical protein BP6252_05880 [Coleophoma cylindrospora]
MSPSKLARYALYAASLLSAVSVAGHTQMGFDVVFPSLSSKLALNDHGAVSAKIGWLEGNMVYGMMAILCAKWAKFGLNDNYDKAAFATVAAYKVFCGIGFARAGIYGPTIPLFGIPALVVSSQLL